MPGISGTGRKQDQKLQKLNKAKADTDQKLMRNLGIWYEQFDSNGDFQLDRNELRKLLSHLYPDNEADEVTLPCPRWSLASRALSLCASQSALDFLIIKATEINSYSLHMSGRPDGFISWDATVKAHAAML